MSFYIRDISKISGHYFKSNADLIVANNYQPDDCSKIFTNIYIYDDSKEIFKFHIPSRKFKDHNKELFITKNLDFNFISKLVLEKNYSLIEIIISDTVSPENIDKVILQISSYFADLETSVGLLISNKNYIDSHKEFLDINGFFISKFIPEIINLEEEGMHPNSLEKSSLIENGAIHPQRISKKTRVLKTPSIKVHRDFVIEESFKDKLIRYLNKSKKSNVQVYTKGGITRKLFSKILSEKDYSPKKETICCLIIGMELCLDDALDLLNAAGYTLTNSLLSDVIIKKHITDKKFNIEIINEELDEHGLTVLGWKPREEN